MQLGIVTLGHVHTEDLTALTPHFDRLEQLVLDIHPHDPLEQHRAELNRAIDAATADWILIIRERETIDDALAKEIRAVAGTGTAWGFRIRSTPVYAGKPLRIGKHDGELRLLHRRHMLRRGDLGVQGSVVRLTNELHSVTFASYDEHRAHLAKQAAPHSSLRRALLFASYVLATRAFDKNTLRYLWIEAGYDVPSSSGSSVPRSSSE